MADWNKIITKTFAITPNVTPATAPLPDTISISGPSAALTMRSSNTSVAVMIITKLNRAAFTPTDTINAMVTAFRTGDLSTYRFKVFLSAFGVVRDVFSFVEAQGGVINLALAVIPPQGLALVGGYTVTDNTGVSNSVTMLEGEYTGTFGQSDPLPAPTR